jgi:hypothetical protein
VKKLFIKFQKIEKRRKTAKNKILKSRRAEFAIEWCENFFEKIYKRKIALGKKIIQKNIGKKKLFEKMTKNTKKYFSKIRTRRN